MAFPGMLTLGDIKGEATEEGHKGKIKIYDFEYGATIPTSSGAHLSGALTLNKAQFSNVGLKVQFGKSSPGLFVACASGRKFDSAKLELYRVEDNKLKVFLTVELTNVVVCDYTLAADLTVSDAHGLADNIQLNYSKIKITYNPPEGGNVPGEYDRAVAK